MNTPSPLISTAGSHFSPEEHFNFTICDCSSTSGSGASNVYFTVTRNAISIPPWTNPINDIMDVQRATIETLVEAMGEEAGLSFAYQKYFGDKYSYEDFKAG